MCITYIYAYTLHHYQTPTLTLSLPLISESTAPVNFTVRDITNTSASFLWSPPLDANGIISDYVVVVSDGATAFQMIITSLMEPLKVTFSDLQPFVHYSATVFGTNGFGNGRSTELNLTTSTGSK